MSENPEAPPEVPAIWFAAIQGERKGPMTFGQAIQLFLNGGVSAQTLFWKKGMAQWQPASEIPELAARFAGQDIPPPLPTNPSGRPYGLPVTPSPARAGPAGWVRDAVFTSLALIAACFVAIYLIVKYFSQFPLTTMRDWRFGVPIPGANAMVSWGSVFFILVVIIPIVSAIFIRSLRTMPNEQPQRVVVTATKSMGISIILTFLFGPLGMLYSTIAGGLIMMVVSVVIGLVTLGFGLILTWPICIIWGALATSSYNRKLLSGQQQY